MKSANPGVLVLLSLLVKGNHKMATIDERFSVLNRYFTPEQKRELINEDLSAGRSVSAVLVAVITMGMVIGAVTVLAITLTH